MTAQTVTLGNPIETRIDIDVEGTPTDPGALVLRYWLLRDKAATETVVTAPNPLSPPAPITRLGVGSYRAILELDLTGLWGVRWEGADPARAASEASVEVTSFYAEEIRRFRGRAVGSSTAGGIL